MSFHQYSFSDCIPRSRRARWRLSDFDDPDMGFERHFLPEAQAWVQRMHCLIGRVTLYLNQIRGYTYAYIYRFAEEKKKQHQELFMFFEKRFQAEFPVLSDLGGRRPIHSQLCLLPKWSEGKN
ncbi:MAG: hypothetical protein ACI835_002866 [Planctomycetota bacterium]|jgi:hypothetical protein